MADISYHLDRGVDAATAGTGAATSDIELIIDNAVGVTKKDVLLALKKFEDAVKSSALFDPLA
jgi:hypothetical protein